MPLISRRYQLFALAAQLKALCKMHETRSLKFKLFSFPPAHLRSNLRKNLPASITRNHCSHCKHTFRTHLITETGGSEHLTHSEHCLCEYWFALALLSWRSRRRLQPNWVRSSSARAAAAAAYRKDPRKKWKPFLHWAADRYSAPLRCGFSRYLDSSSRCRLPHSYSMVTVPWLLLCLVLS